MKQQELGRGRRGCGRTSFVCSAACLLGLLSWTIPLCCQEMGKGEYQIKAAFLFHFAEFVEWPAETTKDGSRPITYCTIGEDPFRGALDESLRAKVIGSREVRVQHLKNAEGIQSCQILFIGAAENNRNALLLERIKGSPVLTVGESERFAEGGGMIEFCREGNKIRFAVNLGAVSAAKLKISARLLTLAKTVIGTGGGG